MFASRVRTFVLRGSRRGEQRREEERKQEEEEGDRCGKGKQVRGEVGKGTGGGRVVVGVPDNRRRRIGAWDGQGTCLSTNHTCRAENDTMYYATRHSPGCGLSPTFDRTPPKFSAVVFNPGKRPGV